MNSERLHASGTRIVVFRRFYQLTTYDSDDFAPTIDIYLLRAGLLT